MLEIFVGMYESAKAYIENSLATLSRDKSSIKAFLFVEPALNFQSLINGQKKLNTLTIDGGHFLTITFAKQQIETLKNLTILAIDKDHLVHFQKINLLVNLNSVLLMTSLRCAHLINIPKLAILSLIDEMDSNYTDAITWQESWKILLQRQGNQLKELEISHLTKVSMFKELVKLIIDYCPNLKSFRYRDRNDDKNMDKESIRALQDKGIKVINN